MPDISNEDQFLKHLGDVKEAFAQAFIAETGCRPEMVQIVHKKAEGDKPETFRFVVRK